MKKLLHKINVWNLVIGIVVGFSLGVTVINALIPDAGEMLRMYRLDPQSLEEDRSKHGSHNAYMMGNVTSERQFVEEMIKHHEAAVMMAQQVLKLNPRDAVKKLANEIIAAQSSEIKMMKEWLSSWK